MKPSEQEIREDLTWMLGNDYETGTDNALSVWRSCWRQMFRDVKAELKDYNIDQADIKKIQKDFRSASKSDRFFALQSLLPPIWH